MTVRRRISIVESSEVTLVVRAAARPRRLWCPDCRAPKLMLKPIDVDRGIDMHAEVRGFEIELIETALALAGGCQAEAARLLGLRATTLHEKLKRYGFAVGREVPAAAPESDAPQPRVR